MRKPNVKLLGHVAVDSGQLLITDPCYLDKWINDDPFGHPILKDKSTGIHYTCSAHAITNPQKLKLIEELNVQLFRNYQEIIRDGKTMNDLMEKNDMLEILPPDPENPFGYAAACQVTRSSKNGGEIGNAIAVVSGYGDGHYPVYVQLDENDMVKRLFIDF